ncbi:MAG TPA: GNAT family N-acetyltransferase [Anaerolineae bacterium]|nr:GNAT family N-acetyltransferase [Anaerolineae bacterium]HMR66323.1 GNAT family N-acetyltransferase [Anaerolineae bacterium]
MTINIFLANSDDEIKSCFEAFKVLRPHLDQNEFLPQVKRQQQQGYKILALSEDGVVKSVAGFREAEFLAWGKIIYIDDLSTVPEARAKGYGDRLLSWIFEKAKEMGLNGVHLDTGYTRHAAHRLYLKNGMRLACHHLAIEFT